MSKIIVFFGSAILSGIAIAAIVSPFLLPPRPTTPKANDYYCFLMEQAAVRGWYDARADVLDPGKTIDWAKLKPLFRLARHNPDTERHIFMTGAFYALGVEDYAHGISVKGARSHVAAVIGCK